METFEIKSEIKSLLVEYYQLQAQNKKVVDYLSSDLKSGIQNASQIILTGETEAVGQDEEIPCDPKEVFQTWLDETILVAKSATYYLLKHEQHNFDVDLAKKYLSTAIPTERSNTRLELYILGKVCSMIIKHPKDNLTELSWKMDDLMPPSDVNIIANIWQNDLGINECLHKSHLPKTDYLAKLLLSLYIASTEDYWWLAFSDIDPGEYSTVRAGYIYFPYGDKAGDVRVKSDGTVVDEDKLTCTPMLDDVPDGKNIIKTLHILFGSNTRLIDLPIRLKVKVRLVLSEAVGPGAGSLIVGGANGWTKLVYDRDLNGKWTQVFTNQKLYEEALLDAVVGAWEVHDILNNLISEFTLNDLIYDK